MKDFAQEAHKHNVKAIASIASSFIEATDNADGSRDRLVANVTKYLIDNKLDGIDYDWEGPVLTDEQRDNYSNLIKETHEAFKPYGFTVCIDTCWRKELYPWAIEYIDWINCMAYDGEWPNHSSFERGVKLLETWELTKGAPREKLLWGTGFYARNKSGNALEYKKIMDKYHPGPEVDLVDEWGYPGIDNTKRRTQYVLDKGYGGMMIWNLDHDTQDETSLLKAIDDTIKGISVSKPVAKKPTPILPEDKKVTPEPKPQPQKPVPEQKPADIQKPEPFFTCKGLVLTIRTCR